MQYTYNLLNVYMTCMYVYTCPALSARSAQDLKKDGVLEEGELIKLNEKIAMLHYGKAPPPAQNQHHVRIDGCQMPAQNLSHVW